MFYFFHFSVELELLRATLHLYSLLHSALFHELINTRLELFLSFFNNVPVLPNNSHLKRAEVKFTGQEKAFSYYQYTVSVFKAAAFRHVQKSIIFHRYLQFCHEPWQVGTGEGHGPSPFWCITTCAGNSDSVPSNPNFFSHYYYQATCWDCAAPLSPASERWQRALLGAVRTTLCVPDNTVRASV